MVIEPEPPSPNIECALKEIARHLSVNSQNNKAESAIALFNAYMKGGAYRRALVDGLTDDDVRRLYDVLIGLENRRSM